MWCFTLYIKQWWLVISEFFLADCSDRGPKLRWEEPDQGVPVPGKLVQPRCHTGTRHREQQAPDGSLPSHGECLVRERTKYKVEYTTAQHS